MKIICLKKRDKRFLHEKSLDVTQALYHIKAQKFIDEVEFAAVGQDAACSADQIFGRIQIQLQRKGQGNGCQLPGL